VKSGGSAQVKSASEGFSCVVSEILVPGGPDWAYTYQSPENMALIQKNLKQLDRVCLGLLLGQKTFKRALRWRSKKTRQNIFSRVFRRRYEFQATVRKLVRLIERLNLKRLEALLRKP
jgi:hypothetical protein